MIAIATLPVITNLAIAYFDQGDTVSLPPVEVIKVFVLILVPVAIGMAVRSRRPDFAERMDHPVRIASAVILAVLVIGILAGEAENVGDYLAAVPAAVYSLLMFFMAAAWGVLISKRIRRTENASVS